MRTNSRCRSSSSAMRTTLRWARNADADLAAGGTARCGPPHELDQAGVDRPTIEDQALNDGADRSERGWQPGLLPVAHEPDPCSEIAQEPITDGEHSCALWLVLCPDFAWRSSPCS